MPDVIDVVMDVAEVYGDLTGEAFEDRVDFYSDMNDANGGGMDHYDIVDMANDANFPDT